MSTPAKLPAAIHHIWWQLAGLILASVLAVYAGVEFDRELSSYLPEGTSMPSVFNRKASGYSALAELASKTGLRPHAWQAPYRELSGIRGTLVIVGPSESLQDYELDQILKWVASGNNLIYLDEMVFDTARNTAKRLGMTVDFELPVTDELLKVQGEDPDLTDVPNLVVTADSRISGGKPVVQDARGPLISRRRCGGGMILMGVVPNLCANRRLSDKSSWPNFQFMINCLATLGGDIWFDELCHGYSRGTNVFYYLAAGPLGLVCLQMLLALALAVISSAQRFGPPSTSASRRASTNMEYINGLANTYAKAQASDLALDILDRALRTRLSRSLGVSGQISDSELAQAWSAATGQEPGELLKYLCASQSALQGNKPSQQELIELLSVCDKISERSQELFKTRRAKPG